MSHIDQRLATARTEYRKALIASVSEQYMEAYEEASRIECRLHGFSYIEVIVKDCEGGQLKRKELRNPTDLLQLRSLNNDNDFAIELSIDQLETL